MAKKGAAIALQTEVNNEEDWEKLLDKIGLVVVDVYSEWCGPCVAMAGILRSLKNRLGSDYLHYAIAKADYIEVLERFRNKSEPTWMFIASGRMVNLMFGPNAPQLTDMIVAELKIEEQALAGKRDRKALSFTKLTKVEIDREEEIARKIWEEKAREENALVVAVEELKLRNLTRWARILMDRTVILYFPHVVRDDGSSDVAYRMFSQLETIKVVDTTLVAITKDMLPLLFYDCEINFSPAFMESLLSSPSLANLMKRDPDEPGAKKLELGDIEREVTTFIYGHFDNMGPPARYSFAERNCYLHESGEIWPSLWTPATYLSKASAVDALFPNLRKHSIEFKEEFLPPPRYLMIFNASRAKEVHDVIKEFPDAIVNMAFFDSTDPTVAKKIANNMNQLEKLSPDKSRHAKMVMAVAKKTSDPLLALSQLNPLYISPNIKIGSTECSKFFPPPDVFAEDEDEFEEEIAYEDKTEMEEQEEDCEEGEEDEDESEGEGEENEEEERMNHKSLEGSIQEQKGSIEKGEE